MSDCLIALIAEGAAERAILKVLLDNQRLKYTYDELLQEDIVTTRSASQFQKHYLMFDLPKDVLVYRILDSRRERFKLSKAYSKNVKDIVNLYTTPEIEILFIIYHNEFSKYTQHFKSKMKPSEYVKANYQDLKNIKNYENVYTFWNSRVDELVAVLKEYARLSNHGITNTIADLLI